MKTNFKDYTEELKDIIREENEKALYKWYITINKSSVVFGWDYGASFKITQGADLYEGCEILESVCDYGYGFDKEAEGFGWADVEANRWSDYQTMAEAVPGFVRATIEKANHLF